MLELVGLLLLLVALTATTWWVTTDHPYKGWAFAMCLAAVFGGAFLVLQDRAIEITVKGVGTIKAAAEQASSDARAITDLRDRIEAQSATIDLVAQQATKAQRLTDQLSEKTVAAEKKLDAIDTALAKARKRVDELDEITEFTKTVIAAQNDDRRAFDQLKVWANDRSFPLREEALSAWRTILDERSQPFFASGFRVPWKEGVDPAKLTLADLRRNYQTAPVWLKPGLIEYIWNRDDIPKKERMVFLAEVVESDASLKAVEYAGRYLSGALDAKLKPLAVTPLLEVWEEKKSSVE